MQGKRVLGSLAVAIAWGILIATPVAAKPSPAQKCAADKNKEAGKYASCRLSAEAKAIRKGTTADHSKCDAKFQKKWERIDLRGAGQCPVTGDLTPVQGLVTTCGHEVTALIAGAAPGSCPAVGLPASGQTTTYGAGSDGAVQAGTGLSYTDNGDGTITDNNTGLMWEKKDDSGGIHAVNEVYTWGEVVPPHSMNGTVTAFLAALNADGGFAGYTDWRLPNVKELHSIVNYEVAFPGPTVHPAFHDPATCFGCTDVTAPSCTCTASANYWSSTTYQGIPNYAWAVGYYYGTLGADLKSDPLRARAVRGGS